MSSNTARTSPLLVAVLTFVLTVVAMLLLFAYVPNSKVVYQWLPRASQTYFGIPLNTNNALVKSIVDAMNRLLKVGLSEMCLQKDDFLGFIDQLPASHEEDTCSSRTDQMEASFALTTIGKNLNARAAYSALLQAITSAVCQDDHVNHDKVIVMLKDMVEAACS